MKKALVFIAVAACLLAPLAAQSVTVTSPNGGESWALNSSQTITWTPSNAGSVKVDIILRRGEVKVGVIKSQVALSDGAWTWALVGTLENGTIVAPRTDYTVRIRNTGNTVTDDSNSVFAIAPPLPVIVHRPDRPLPPPLPFLKPKLAVTTINLTPNASGYGIIFGYKNVGDAALPKRSELTVKPDYRVLIDGREVDKGDLFIPQTPPAAPGWEMTTHSGGFINFPANEPKPWNIGKEITIILNERNALNMGSASKTSSLLPIVLQVGYNLAFAGPAIIDWGANKASVTITKVGSIPQNSTYFSLQQTIRYYHTNTVHGGATVTYPDGPYTDVRNKKFPITGPFPLRVDIPMEPSSYYDLDFQIFSQQRDQFDERDDALPRTRFERPGIPAGPRIHSVSFSTRADSRGKPTQLRTVITLLNEADHGVGGLRLVLKRDGSQAEEWKEISLSAGQKQLYINYGSLPKPYPPAYFQIFLYEGGNHLIDSRSEVE